MAYHLDDHLAPLGWTGRLFCAALLAALVWGFVATSDGGDSADSPSTEVEYQSDEYVDDGASFSGPSPAFGNGE